MIKLPHTMLALALLSLYTTVQCMHPASKNSILIKHTICNGGSINDTLPYDDQQLTPLQFAALTKDVSLVEWLLDRGGFCYPLLNKLSQRITRIIQSATARA